MTFKYMRRALLKNSHLVFKLCYQISGVNEMNNSLCSFQVSNEEMSFEKLQFSIRDKFVSRISFVQLRGPWNCHQRGTLWHCTCKLLDWLHYSEGPRYTHTLLSTGRCQLQAKHKHQALCCCYFVVHKSCSWPHDINNSAHSRWRQTQSNYYYCRLTVGEIYLWTLLLLESILL